MVLGTVFLSMFPPSPLMLTTEFDLDEALLGQRTVTVLRRHASRCAGVESVCDGSRVEGCGLGLRGYTLGVLDSQARLWTF